MTPSISALPMLPRVAIVAVIGLGGCCLSAKDAIAQPTIAPTPPTAPLTTPSVEQILIGEWQLKDILPIGIKAVFASENKLYVFIPSAIPFLDGFTPEPIALDFRYKLNTTTAPYQLDILSPSGGDPLLTIFELPTAREMRVEFIGLKPGEPRPTSLTVGSVILEKISTITALPRNTKVYDVQAERLKRSQAQARSTMFNLNSSQAFYYSQQKKFASSITELGAFVPKNDYNYKTSLHPSQTGAISIAEAKAANLKSYSAAVVIFKTRGKTNTFSGVCETEAPSKTAPALPKIDNKGKITCPSGAVISK